MSEFTQPPNSKVREGKRFAAKGAAKTPRAFKVYRWDPDRSESPRLDTYEIDLAEHPLEEVLAARLRDYELEETLEEFAGRLVRGVYPIRKELDGYSAEHAPEWPIDQISIIDRNLIRMAVWEFAISQQTPVKVAINEAVELAKRYGSDSSSRFVNGVLGSLA